MSIYFVITNVLAVFCDVSTANIDQEPTTSSSFPANVPIDSCRGKC